MDHSAFDARPIIVAIAGPNGAGRTTFFHAHLAAAALRFVNADRLSTELGLDPYHGARIANAIRRELVRQRESFAFETVFSDPVQDKVGFLADAVAAGYTVLLCYIGVESAEICEQRVAMRVSQGGHDVPTDKLHERLPRTIANLDAAIRRLPYVLVFDNSELGAPYRQVAAFEGGRLALLRKPVPRWLAAVLAAMAIRT